MGTTAVVSASSQTSYLALEAAGEEQESRSALRSVVEEWWMENGWGCAPLPEVPNRAVLARQLCTFRYEDATFATMAEQGGLTPVWMSYNGDKMSTESPLKRSYIRPMFCSGQGRNGGLKLKPQPLISMEAAFGRRLSEIHTVEGVGLVEYHRAHQERVFPGAVHGDTTAWVQRIGGTARDYYVAYLSQFIAHAILFDDYDGGESGSVLGRFTQDICEPAYAEVTRMFGVQPMLVRLPWWSEMSYYPADANWREHGVRVVP